jgi:hypothetical protein
MGKMENFPDCKLRRLPSELTSEVFTCATMSLTTCPIPQLILPLALYRDVPDD